VQNSNIIPDGVLFTCTFEILPDATLGDKTLANTPSASDAAANNVPVDGADGIITVMTPPGPAIDVGSASGAAGTNVAIAVVLSGSGNAFAATGNDIIYDPTQVRVARNGTAPQCTINSAIGAGTAADKGLLQSIRALEGGLERLRVGVINVQNSNIIPDGTLFTCTFEILPGASAGAKTLANTPSASDAAANSVAVDGVDGTITVQ
jgi:hypothetical protein